METKPCKNPKFAVMGRVSSTGFGGPSDIGTIIGIKWIYHNRLSEWTWGYKVDWDNHGIGFAGEYIPEGYLESQVIKRNFHYPSFRFVGRIPTGKFEFKCICGCYSGIGNILSGDSQSIACKECGIRYYFRRQKNHFHLKVCISENEQFQQECALGLHK